MMGGERATRLWHRESFALLTRARLGAWLACLCAGIWLMGATHAHAQSARVSMSASGSRVTVGEPFAIEIRVDTTGATADDIQVPDFGKLEVLGRRVSRPFSFSFGFGTGGQHAMVQSQVVYGFTLRALAPGTYKIPSAVAVVGGRKYASHALTIEATGAALPAPSLPGAAQPDDTAQAPADMSAPPEGPLEGAKYDPELFVRTVVDEKTPFVGEQVTVTVYLYVRGSLHQSPSITREPTADGFWVQDLLPPQRSLSAVQQEVNGRNYNVYVLRRFAAFPLRAGALHIGAPAVQLESGGSIFDLLNGPSAPTRRSGVPVDLEVKPLPPRKDTSAPVHVGSLTLEASLDPKQARVGDAVTLTVTAKGVGNLKELELPSPRIDGAEVLAPEITDHMTTDLDQIGGSREVRWLVLPRTPGTHSVPTLSVDVLDPADGSYHTVRTSVLSFEATGAADVSASEPPPSDDRAEPALSFGPARASSALLRRELPLYRAPWFLLAVLLGPGALVVTLLGRALRHRAQARAARSGATRAWELAQAKLDEARSATERGDAQAALSALATALKRGVEARLEEPIGGLTRAALRAHLASRGMGAPLVDRIVSQLEACEDGRFDPLGKSRAELDTALEKTRGTLRELDKFTPKKEAA